jgi:hypothetical protein
MLCLIVPSLELFDFFLGSFDVYLLVDALVMYAIISLFLRRKNN